MTSSTHQSDLIFNKKVFLLFFTYCIVEPIMILLDTNIFLNLFSFFVCNLVFHSYLLPIKSITSGLEYLYVIHTYMIIKYNIILTSPLNKIEDTNMGKVAILLQTIYFSHLHYISCFLR